MPKYIMVEGVSPHLVFDNDRPTDKHYFVGMKRKKHCEHDAPLCDRFEPVKQVRESDAYLLKMIRKDHLKQHGVKVVAPTVAEARKILDAHMDIKPVSTPKGGK